MTTRLILDTDIGTDVDDCLALAFILGSPEFSLEGVTCVHGNVGLRAQMVRKLLRLAGRADIPVMVGAEQTLLGLREIYWEGHEGEGLLEPGETEQPPDSGHAAEYIARTVMEQPGQMHLLAIGPLTNIALAIRLEPRLLENLAGFTMMGGVFRGPGDFGLPYVEHNIRCDPEAAHVVFQSATAYRLVPLDVTTKALVRRGDIARLRAAGTPFHDAVATQLERYPKFARTGHTMLHDPLAAALILRPELARWENLRVEVETQGRLTSAATLAMAPKAGEPVPASRVALRIDSPQAEEFVISRIAGER